VAIDGQNNVLVTGSFSGTADFDPGSGTFNLTSQGNRDIFIAKLNPQGDFIWANGFGYVSSDRGLAITTDNQNNIFTTGYYSYEVDMNPSAVQDCTLIGVTGFYDVFVSKHDPNGNFIAACTFGGSLDDFGYAIDVDASGRVLVAGSFQETTDFNHEPGATLNITSNGDRDIFIVQLDNFLGFNWAKTGGGIFQDNGYGIKSDGAGNVYVTGEFRNTADFDPGTGTTNLTSFGSADVFVMKLNSSGDFLWAGQAGGANSNDRALGIDLDANGAVHVVGQFSNTADFDPGNGTANLVNVGGETIFVFKWTTGGSYVWARAFTTPLSSSDNIGRGIVVDQSGNIITTGEYLSTVDFNGGIGTPLLYTAVGSWDSFICKLGASGVGIHESDWQSGMSLYPNPGSGNLHISFAEDAGGALVELFNASGQLVYVRDHISGNSLTLDDLTETGIFMLKITSPTGSYTSRKVIRH
jgi:hypothetical protein